MCNVKINVQRAAGLGFAALARNHLSYTREQSLKCRLAKANFNLVTWEPIPVLLQQSMAQNS